MRMCKLGKINLIKENLNRKGDLWLLEGGGLRFI